MPGFGIASAAPSASDHLEPAGARHLEVEQDDVDGDQSKSVDRIFRARRHRCDLKVAVGFDNPRQHGTCDHRIVDDHQANPRLSRRGLLAIPRFCERPLHDANSYATPTS
jgi:hypothetical protein